MDVEYYKRLNLGSETRTKYQRRREGIIEWHRHGWLGCEGYLAYWLKQTGVWNDYCCSHISARHKCEFNSPSQSQMQQNQNPRTQVPSGTGSNATQALEGEAELEQ
jgi:hypothetical protein